MGVVGKAEAVRLAATEHSVVNVTVGPVKVGTRSTSVTALEAGGPGMEKLVPATAIPVAPSLCGLATPLTVGGSRYVK